MSDRGPGVPVPAGRAAAGPRAAASTEGGHGVREVGSLEREAMEVVRGAGEPVVVHDVVAALNARRAQPLAYTTVMTVMNNLVAKE